MTNDKKDHFHPNTAFSEMNRVEERVRSSRRWHIGTMLVLGILTIAFFSVIGWVPRENIPTTLFAVVSFAPFMIYLVLLEVRKSHPTTSGRELMDIERRLASIYVILLLVSGVIDFFLLKPYQGTVWAAWTGIIPAIPCFYGVWKVYRK
ncbi:MAG TPA: hypothetical protein VFK37_01965 [Bacillales bacterium]|nr:hypothetical protein [Bacillales bacterium]